MFVFVFISYFFLCFIRFCCFVGVLWDFFSLFWGVLFFVLFSWDGDFFILFYFILLFCFVFFGGIVGRFVFVLFLCSFFGGAVLFWKD